MAIETEATRQAALSVIERKGMKWSRVETGNLNRFVVNVIKGDKTIRVLVKTASKGGALVKADSIANDAVISGFDGDINYVLFAVGLPDQDDVAAYLVPFDVAEEAFRSSDRRSWNKKETWAVWVLQFAGPGNRTSNGFVMKWREYLIGTTGSHTPRPPHPNKESSERNASKKLTIAEAKRLLAISLGVPSSNITITIEA